MTAFQLLYSTVRKFPGWLGLSVFLGLLSAWISGASMALVVPLILDMLGQRLVLHGMPPAFEAVMATFDVLPEAQRIAAASSCLVLFVALKSLFAFLSNLASLNLSRLCTGDLRGRALSVLLRADVSYFISVEPGHLVNVIGMQVDQSAKIVVVGSQLLSALLTVAVFVVTMVFLSPALTAAAFILFIAASFVNNSIIRKSSLLGRQSIQQLNRLSSALYQAVAGIRLIKASTSERREEDKLLKLSGQCVDNTFVAGAGIGAITPLTEFTGMLAIVAIVLLGKIFVPAQGAGFSAVLLTFLFLLFRMLAQISLINGKHNELSGSWPNSEALAAFLSTQDKTMVSDGSDLYSPMQEGIRFQDVTFKYASDAEPVLHEISFSIPKGTALALVGGSGAGKTTIADLLSRCYDPSGGCITIDGRDLKCFELRSLRSNIAIVSQDPFLFNDTIGYNIEYSRPNASKAEVREAARRAHALEFIEKLPLGFDSPVGERGNMLSAGERQRVSIARAILTDPDILILDEATSALDSLSEQIVQSALEELMRDRTTLMIAHRLGTVRSCAQIAVLKHGRIVEIGSHSELIARNGLYRRMCEAGSVLLRRSEEV